MVETVENFLRANSPAPRWVAVGLWAVTGLGALRLSFARFGTPRWVWPAVAAAAVGLALETAFPLRFALADLLRTALRALGGDEAVRHRRAIQVGVIGALFPMAVWLAVRLARSRRLRRGEKVALLGVACALFGLALETISLHYLDQFPAVYRAFRFAGLGLAAGGIGVAWRRGRTQPTSVPASSPPGPDSHA